MGTFTYVASAAKNKPKKALKENNLPPKILHGAKLSFKCECLIEIVSGIQGFRRFIIQRCIFKTVFRVFFFFFCILGLHSKHMEVPRWGVELELGLPPQPQLGIRTASTIYATAHGQHQILDPLSKARDWICVLMGTNQVCFHNTTRGPPQKQFLMKYISKREKFRRY